MNAIDIDDEPAERRCANCLERIRQTRLDAEEDDFCSATCSAAWLDWWTKAKSVMEMRDG